MGSKALYLYFRSHLQKTERETMLLIVQCDSGNINGPLAACARYCVMDELQKIRETMRFPFHVVFIIQLPRIAGGCFTGFQVRTQYCFF